MTNTTNITTGRPRSTHFQAVQQAVKNYRVNTKTGLVFNKHGVQVGGYTYEPRLTIHLEDRKYNARINKIVAYVKYGPEALRKGVSVVHKNGNKFDNRGSNLELKYNRSARKAYNRLLRENGF